MRRLGSGGGSGASALLPVAPLLLLLRATASHGRHYRTLATTASRRVCEVRPRSAAASSAAYLVAARHLVTCGVIEADDVSFVDAAEAGDGAADALPAAMRAVCSPALPSAFADVRHINVYARARVVNFVRRYNAAGAGDARAARNELFEMSTVTAESSPRDDDDDDDDDAAEPRAAAGSMGVQGRHDKDDDAGRVLYHCRLRVPLRHPGLCDGATTEGVLWAHGLASSPKEAEHLAAMHAERMIDELGYHVYMLPSMQRKHAEAARQAGRFAPTPDDDDTVHVPSLRDFPLPLRRVHNPDESEGGAWMLVQCNQCRYMLSPHTLLSPCLLDPHARHRVRSLLDTRGFAFAQLCSVESTHDEAADGGGGEGEIVAPSKSHAHAGGATTDAPKFYVAKILLPGELTAASAPPVVAQGKALDADTAVCLAAMHAELLLDALYVELYPHDASLQKAHALTAWGYGRPAPLPGATPRPPSHVSLPTPLKQLVVLRGGRVAPRSPDELFVHHHRVIARQLKDLVETDVCEMSAVDDLRQFLKAHSVQRAGRPFLVRRVYDMCHATVWLPLPDVYGVRGGVGVAPTPQDAETLCAMHALDVLGALGVAVKADAAAQTAWMASRQSLVTHVPRRLYSPAEASPPGRRLRHGGFARHVVVSTSAARRDFSIDVTAAQPADEARPVGETTAAAVAPQGKTVVRPRKVKRARVTMTDTPPAAAASAAGDGADVHTNEKLSDKANDTSAGGGNAGAPTTGVPWSALQADGPDGFIVVKTDRRTDGAEAPRVSPTTVTPAAINSPRELDKHSKDRIRPFFASMGRRLKDSFHVEHVDADENAGLAVYRCVCVLPVPARYGDRVARGESTQVAEAEQLAAMHAELLLDQLGICLYGDPVLQRRHADACAERGRWAPRTAADARPPDTPSPPPLRSARASLMQWKQATEAAAASTDTREPGAVREAAGHQSDTTTAPSSEAASAGTSVAAAAATIAAASDAPAPQAAQYTAVYENELDAVAKSRVQYYLRRQRREVRIEHEEVNGYNLSYHVVRWRLPLPAGTRPNKDSTQHADPPPGEDAAVVLVQGTAGTKKDAELLSWMHAERSLDALGVPLFDNLPGLQRWHATCVAQQGRWAPHDAARTPPTPPTAPPPLRLMPTPALELACPVRPDLPAPSMTTASLDDEAGRDVWQKYIEACAAYVQQKAMSTQCSLLVAERVPRTGLAMYDKTLGEAERASGEEMVAAKTVLQQYARLMGPDQLAPYRTNLTGSQAVRVFLCSIAVPQHSYVRAQGVGANKELAQRRAAVHALRLLRYLDGDYGERYPKAVTAAEAEMEQQQQQQQTVGDEIAGEEQEADGAFMPDPTLLIMADARKLSTTDEEEGEKKAARRPHRGSSLAERNMASGKLTELGYRRLLELFVLCSGTAPPVVRNFVHIQSAASPPRYRTEVCVCDEDGKTWSASCDKHGPEGNTIAASESLCTTLVQQVPMCAELRQLLSAQPYVDPRQIVSLSLSDVQRQRLRRLIDRATSLDERERRDCLVGDDTELNALSLLNRLRQHLHIEPIMQGGSSGHADSGDGKPAAATAAAESAELQQRLRAKLASSEYQASYARQRGRLSIAAHAESIVQAVESNQVVLICGTTGCGKTTQVPQYILDHLTEQGRGAACSLLITQPRRLSVVSIARRVAAERLERVGDVCGYAVRLDAQLGRRVNFCTTGVLLRMLLHSPNLDAVNYLIIDEIHERDINSDFLLVLLRQLLRRRPDLHLVLMSATLQAEQFAHYFGNAPIITVEGYVYPVQELFLEDLVPYAEQKGTMTPLLKEVAASRRGGDADSPRRATQATAVGVVDGRSRQTRRYDVLQVASEIDYATVQFAVEQARRMVDLHDASVLVFLPGWGEMTRAKEILERNPDYEIILLHSSVTAEEQMRCFLPAKPGKIKLILSTNIAESGVTIDDIGAVIDVGRMKERCFVFTPDRRRDEQEGEEEQGRAAGGWLRATSRSDTRQRYSATQLLTVYASRANCVQRRGRVGRTRPGICIRLYSRAHFDALHDFQTPEMLRVPLDTLCLQILALSLGNPVTFLQNALEPPPKAQVEAAMTFLTDLGAIRAVPRGEAEEEERCLTALGWRLAMLPVEPRMGKIILLGAVLRCLDSALTIAATSNEDVFVASRDARDVVRMHREQLSNNTQSDALAAVNAFNFWVTSHFSNSPAQLMYELQDRLLHAPQLLLVSRYKRQFYDILVASGFLGSELGVAADARPRRDGGTIFVERSDFSRDACDVGLVKCVVASGMLPHVALSCGRRLLRTKSLQGLQPTTDSVIYRTPHHNLSFPFLLYQHLFKTQVRSNFFAFNLTAVSFWTLLLLSPESMRLSYRHELNLGILDDWIYFHASFALYELVRQFKLAFDACLNRKFLQPGDAANNALLEEMREAVKELVNSGAAPNTLVTETCSEHGSLIAPVLGDTGEAAPVATSGAASQDAQA